MRFVSVKSREPQVISAIHTARHGYIKNRTACMSRIGSLLLEFGIALSTGHSVMKELFNSLAQQKQELPGLLIQELMELHLYYLLNDNIEKQDKKLKQLVETNPVGQLLKTIPGIGDMTASLCIANISRPRISKVEETWLHG